MNPVGYSKNILKGTVLGNGLYTKYKRTPRPNIYANFLQIVQVIFVKDLKMVYGYFYLNRS